MLLEGGSNRERKFVKEENDKSADPSLTNAIVGRMGQGTPAPCQQYNRMKLLVQVPSWNLVNSFI